MHNKFHNLIDDLRILNQQFRKERPDPKEFLDSIRYAIEYCTITIDIGRQTGKSTYIKNNASPDTAVVVMNQKMKDLFKDCDLDVFTAREVQFKKGVYNKYKTIFVDEPSFVFRTIDKYELYAHFVNNVLDQTFILIGM
jgi:hypothetical protein